MSHSIFSRANSNNRLQFIVTISKFAVAISNKVLSIDIDNLQITQSTEYFITIRFVASTASFLPLQYRSTNKIFSGLSEETITASEF